MTPAEMDALESAANLCFSEANRMHHDPRTAHHWIGVANTILDIWMKEIVRQAMKEVKPIVDAEREGERVTADTMNFIMRGQP